MEVYPIEPPRLGVLSEYPAKHLEGLSETDQPETLPTYALAGLVIYAKKGLGATCLAKPVPMWQWGT
jgi:hypothetical protein